MMPIRPYRLLLAAGLLLALAACGDKGGTAAAAGGVPVAAVPPPAGKAWSDVVVATPEGGYRMGNPAAPIKLIEYGSLTCPHCADFNKESAGPLRDTYVASGKVSFEFRNFVRDAIDVTGTMLTHCGTPDSFFALTEQTFANQPAMFAKAQGAGDAAFQQAMAAPDDQRFVRLGELTGLTDFFASRGIAKTQANACLAKSATADALAKATEQQGTQYAIEGTPTFLINGEKIGTATWADLKARLDGMGAR